MKYLFPVGLLLVSAIAPATAQVTSAGDNTGTVVNSVGNTFNITGGTTAGTNQFHSFQQFGLSNEQVANFIANPAIQNILSRVTGGDPSVIHGLIRVTGGNNPNLYLMNPAGVIFGANASLNVPASFTVTTANGIGFANGWFNAIGNNNYATLLGNPEQFAFTTTNPGSIINEGKLSVGSQQTLTLLAGTILSTGSLAAPDGNLIVTTVAGEKLVRITQPGSLLSLELPLDVAAKLPGLLPAASLPELVTGGGLNPANEVVVEDGVVKLTAGATVVTLGDVAVKQAIAQTASLEASNNILLVEGQLQTTGNLQIGAGNTALLRDSATQPSVIQAGGNLTIAASTIDIFTLTLPNSVLQAGGDLVLRSPNTIRGDAFYITGGDLRFETPAGSPGNVESPNDPIILAQGDVSLNTYTGQSLHILAGGSVTVGAIVITNFGTSNNTINPGNPLALNPTRTLGSLANVTRANGQPISYNGVPVLNTANEVERINPTPLVIDGSTSPTVDIRAGIDWSQLGGLPGNTNLVTPTGQSVPGFGTFSSPATSANIQIDSIQIDSVFGPTSPPLLASVVYLTNQYYPNLALTSGEIQVDGTPVPTSDFLTPSANIFVSAFNEQNAIVIDSRGGITTGNIYTPQGNVDLAAQTAIATGNIIATTPSSARATSIVLSTQTGNIVVQRLEAGGNGIDIQAGGLFQALSFKDNENLGNVVKVQSNSALGTELVNFYNSKGIPIPLSGVFVGVEDLPISIFARPSNNKSPGSLNAPVTIRTEDGSRGFSQTFPIFPGLNLDPEINPAQNIGLISVRFGNSGFSGGPVVGQIVPGSDPFIQSDDTPVTNSITSLKRNQSYTPLVFGSEAFPNTASGLVGSITIAAGSDNGFYSAIQDQVFGPITGGGGTGGGGTGGGETGGGGTGGSTGGETGGGVTIDPNAAQAVERQLNQTDRADACSTSGTLASGTRSPQLPEDQINEPLAPGTTNPCGAVEDSDILKILEIEPQSSRSRPERAAIRTFTPRHFAPTLKN